jgi:hypothetical protein
LDLRELEVCLDLRVMLENVDPGECEDLLAPKDLLVNPDPQVAAVCPAQMVLQDPRDRTVTVVKLVPVVPRVNLEILGGLVLLVYRVLEDPLVGEAEEDPWVRMESRASPVRMERMERLVPKACLVYPDLWDLAVTRDPWESREHKVILDGQVCRDPVEILARMVSMVILEHLARLDLPVREVHLAVLALAGSKVCQDHRARTVRLERMERRAYKDHLV